MDSRDTSTSLTLLGRLRQSPADAAAWEEFVRRYRPQIAGWCRQWGVQDADAEDVTQMVLLALTRQMSQFVYKPEGKFRSWLKSVAHNTWCDLLERQGRPGYGTGDSAVVELLQSLPAREDFLDRLEQQHQREVLELASIAVRRRVDAQSWEAFRLLTLEDVPGPQVAQQLGMKVGTVYVASCRVTKLLREESLRIDGVDTDESG